MPIPWTILGGQAVTAAERLVNGVGKGLGSLMNRVGWTEKLAEGERWDKMIEASELAFKDVDSARQMLMIEMQTQKLPWFVRAMNGFFRPMAGYMSLLYLFEHTIAEALNQFSFFNWSITTHSPVTDGCALAIIGFFFGLRQRSKEKAITSIA